MNPPVNTAMPPKTPVNILLVDDQPARLLSYESVLASLGENLIRANSGNEALDLLLKNEIAVVLVDVVMPELDGFELARMIRRHPRFRKTAIILVSGVMVEDAYRLKGYDSGAVDYVSVPIIPEILRAKVAVFADLYRKTEELERLNQDLERRVEARTREIEAARREAEHANQLKDEFLATVSHELRTPLHAITGWAHLLLMGGLSAEDQTKAVETIQRNADAQARLMADLLDVSRIINGKLRIELQPVRLEAAVQAALDSIRPAAEAKHIQIEADLCAGGELSSMLGDLARLQQIAGNLLSNAVKFTPAGGHIQVNLRPEPGGNGLQLSVGDDGPGIAEEFLPYIFERFRQGDHTSTRRQRGLGLGLTIVRHLAEAHGGAVAARNRAGRSGAILTVTFPLTAIPPPATAAEREAPVPLIQDVCVLVVDDEADGREAIARILEAHGAEAMVAASAAEALAILRHRHPDVILTDIEMPHEDGYALVRQIRALPDGRARSLAVAALTAAASAQDRAKLLAAGFQDHVPKPVRPPELVRVIGALAPTRAKLAAPAKI